MSHHNFDNNNNKKHGNFTPFWQEQLAKKIKDFNLETWKKTHEIISYNIPLTFENKEDAVNAITLFTLHLTDATKEYARICGIKDIDEFAKVAEDEIDTDCSDDFA